MKFLNATLRIPLFAIAIVLFITPGTSYAQGATGQSCNPNSTINTCPAGTQCWPNADGNTGTCKSTSSGCTPACTNGQVCNLALNQCTTPKTCDASCPAGQCDQVTGLCSGGVTGSSTGSGSTGSTDLGFVSLTKVPGLDTIGTSGSLSSFLNNIYKYCIGAAAVIAVIQLIRAGIQYMLEGGFMEKKEAKQLIGQTIAGLLLVLSPVIVFGIINPKILSLSIDTSQLQVTTTIPAGAAGSSTPNTTGDGTCTVSCTAGTTCQLGKCVAQSGGSCSAITDGTTLTTTQQQTCCQAQSGCSVKAATSGGATTYTCSCSAYQKFAWKANFNKPGGGQETIQKGPFSTQDQCYQSSANDVPKGDTLIDPPGFICSCGQSAASQGYSCPQF